MADSQSLTGEDIFERIHIDNDGENRQTIDADTCQRNQYAYCKLTFAVGKDSIQIYYVDKV